MRLEFRLITRKAENEGDHAAIPLAQLECRAIVIHACGELERGFDEEMARTEAARCLQCGLICYKHTALDELQPSEAASEVTA